MAHLLRGLAVIGLIAFNSPVHRQSEGEGAPSAPVAAAPAKPVIHDPVRPAQGLAAAREAAQILAGLDPETRGKVLALVGTGLSRSIGHAP